MKKQLVPVLFLTFLTGFCFSIPGSAQMITGTWAGRINRQKVEVKIIQNGDSLTGTSYYYESANTYRRYSIRGYFDALTNETVWWDDQLLDEKSGRFSIGIPGKIPLLSRADFNCPGGTRMFLNGKAEKKEDDKPGGEVHLEKTNNPVFEDEWDFVIDNYTSGTNDPYIIDSVNQVALHPPVKPEEPVTTIAEEKPVVKAVPAEKPVVKTEPVLQKTPPPPVRTIEPAKPLTIEEKFTARQKSFVKEIPASGDSIELRFYDNAEIDGDSISLFLNGKLLFEHIRLTGNPYTIKLAVSDLNDSNELIMVAENMGTIPPNTSYMIAMVNNVRYDAYLASTEGSSAMIRFVKKTPATGGR